MKKPLRILDKIFTHVTIIAMLAFMVYGCTVVPDSPLVPFATVCVLAYLFWIAADIYFWFNDRSIDRDIQRYIDSGFDPNSVKRRYF